MGGACCAVDMAAANIAAIDIATITSAGKKNGTRPGRDCCGNVCAAEQTGFIS